jgi:outer membrane protein, heavy metal efflux system
VKTRHRHPRGVILAVILAAARAAAQPAAPDRDALPAPGVEALVAEALERAPSLAAARARVAAAREMIAPAGALPNPMVELALTDVSFPRFTVGNDEMSMLGPEVRQAFPSPGKRRAARDAQRALGDVLNADLELSYRMLAAQVRTVYARVYALDRERQALVAARELLDMLAATVTSRYAVGDAEQEAVIRTQLEGSRVAERTDDLGAERAVLVAALDRLLDRSGGPPLGAIASLPAAPAPPLPWESGAVAGSAGVATRRAAVAAAERRVESARIDSRPDLFLGAGLGLRGQYDPVVSLRFGVELPLWQKERQHPMVRAAALELEMTRAELRDAEAAARSEAARLAAEWTRAERQITRYRQAILPQTSAAVDAARASYLAGRGDFDTVVADFREWLDARTALAVREADRFAVWAELQALLGEPGGAAGSVGGGL